jgi:hypothetical protein
MVWLIFELGVVGLLILKEEMSVGLGFSVGVLWFLFVVSVWVF